MWTLVNSLVNSWHLWGFFFRLYKTKPSSVNKVDFFLKEVLYFAVPQTINMWKNLFKSCQAAGETREYKQNCTIL